MVPGKNTEDVAREEVSFEAVVGRAELYRRQGRQVAVVQGLGVVGTAVAAAIASATDPSGQPLYFVIGVDLPDTAGRAKIGKLNSGLPPIASPDPLLSRIIEKAVKKIGNLSGTVCEEAYALADVVVVDVPFHCSGWSSESPLSVEVDLESFKDAVKMIGRFMRPEALVLVESTIPVGTCEQVVLPALREERKKRGLNGAGYLAYAYERVMPGPRHLDSVLRYWRTFAGLDRASAARARQFLSSFIDVDAYPLVELDDLRACEMAKLLENSYRALNIAFIYEWTLMAEETGINLFAVVDSIRVRKGTHDNMRLPGFGVGGYCLPKDSLLAQWSLTRLFKSEIVLGMTLEALRVNRRMPLHTFHLLSELFEGDLKGKTIAICGISYLPEVPDTRNSPTEVLVDELLKTGSDVIVHDPYVERWPEREGIRVTQDLTSLRQADGIVFAVSHPAYRCLMPHALSKDLIPALARVVDAQNVVSDEEAELLHRAGCRLLGVGKGHWKKKGYQ